MIRYNELGQFLGLQKVQIIDVNDSTYTVRFSNLNGAGDATIKIKKNSAYNFSFLSFDNGGQSVMVEPPKFEWDIVFTQYTHIFYNPVTPYLVTGCLLNRYHTSAYMDTSASFLQITLSNIDSKRLSSLISVIGYDWKAFTGSTYITNTKMNYIIRYQNRIYYKLYFIDFYNTSGVKGNPKLEYQQL